MKELKTFRKYLSEDNGRSYGHVTVRLIDFTDGKNQKKI